MRHFLGTQVAALAVCAVACSSSQEMSLLDDGFDEDVISELTVGAPEFCTLTQPAVQGLFARQALTFRIKLPSVTNPRAVVVTPQSLPTRMVTSPVGTRVACSAADDAEEPRAGICFQISVDTTTAAFAAVHPEGSSILVTPRCSAGRARSLGAPRRVFVANTRGSAMSLQVPLSRNLAVPAGGVPANCTSINLSENGRMICPNVEEIAAAKALGVKWMRDPGFEFAYFKLNGDACVTAGCNSAIGQMMAAHRQVVDYVHSQGMYVLSQGLGVPVSYRWNQAKVHSPPGFAGLPFYASLAAEMARNGADAFEVWNEPNLGGFWDGVPVDSSTYGRLYGLLLKQTSAAIRAVPGNTTVIVTGGLASVAQDDVTHPGNAFKWMSDVISVGAGHTFDAFGYHPYALTNTFVPQSPDVCPTAEGVKYHFYQKAREVSVALASLGQRVPVWGTEAGVPTEGPDCPRSTDLGDFNSHVGSRCQVTQLDGVRWVSEFIHGWMSPPSAGNFTCAPGGTKRPFMGDITGLFSLYQLNDNPNYEGNDSIQKNYGIYDEAGRAKGDATSFANMPLAVKVQSLQPR